MATRSNTLLLSTGMAAAVVYTLHVLLGGWWWKGYRHLHQPISDLTATGAPNRAGLLALTTIYGLLALTFALVFLILESKKHHRMVVIGAVFFVALHLLSLSYGLFPQDLPGQPATFAGTMHLAVTALIVPCTLLAPLFIGWGLLGEPEWKKFGYLSLVTSLLLLLFGGTTAYLFARELPYFGLAERLNIGTLQLWTCCFSFKLVKNSLPRRLKQT